MKNAYYTNRISENIKNIKKIWGIINEILKKQKKKRIYNYTYKYKRSKNI